MSVVSKDTLKGYFETGDKPTQQQFANLIDSLRSVLTEIEFTDFSAALKGAFNSKSTPHLNWVKAIPYTVMPDECRVFPTDLVIDTSKLTVAASNSTLTFGAKTFTKKAIVQVAGDVLLFESQAVIDGDMYVGGFLYVMDNSSITGNGFIY